MTLSPPPGRGDTAERLIDALAPEGPALVIVRGHRGAGKTTLLRYLGDVARHRKHPLVEMEGASGMTTVPYGAMAELLSIDATEGLAAHRAAVEALTGPGSGPRPVAIIDDADRLDDPSATRSPRRFVTAARSTSSPCARARSSRGPSTISSPAMRSLPSSYGPSTDPR